MSKKTVFAFSVLALTACFLSYKVGSAPVAFAKPRAPQEAQAVSATLPAPPAEWVVSGISQTTGTGASATRAGVSGVQHVADCVSFTSFTTETGVAGLAQLLDGNTVLMEWLLPSQAVMNLCGINAVGSAGNSMILRFNGSPNPNSGQSVNLVGHDAT